MKALRIPLLSTLAGLALLVSTSQIQAVDCPPGAACTEPVGFVTLTANPSSDGVNKKISLIGLGLFNAVEFQGPIDSVNGSVLGVTGIQAGQFDEFYFVQIASGDNSGIMVDIVSTSIDSVTLAQDLSTMVSVGNIIKIRKHHTMASVFGTSNEMGLVTGTNPIAADIIQIFGPDESKTLFFLTGANVWTDGIFNLNNLIIYPDQGLLFRRIGTESASIKLLGSVKTDTTGITVENGFNIINNVYPVDTTLGTSGLNTNDGGTTGVLPGTNPIAADNIRIVNDQGQVGIYFLVNAANNIWTDGIFPANDVVIKAGSSFILDRKSNSFNWLQQPTF